jgi:hypothetical protein
MVTSRTIKYLLWICPVISILLFTAYSIAHIPLQTEGFAAYYRYSRTLFEGKDFAELYDFNTFNDPQHSFGISKLDAPNNLPTNAFALLPFAWMDAQTARIAWSVVSIILYLSAIYILLCIYNIRWRTKIGLSVLSLFFLWYPSYSNVRFGQIYFLLLFLFVLSLYGIKKHSLLLTAVPIAFAIVLKGYGIISLLWLAYNKRWREVAITLGVTALVIIASLPFFGIDAWATYYNKVVLQLNGLPSGAHVVYQEINGFIHHLFLYNKDWSPSPLVALPESVVIYAGLIINIFVIGMTIILSSKTKNMVMSYATAIAVGVVTSPLSFEYHYILFLPLVIGLLAKLFNEDLQFKPDISSIILLAAIVLMALPLHYADLQTASAPLILLAYPKLYAGLAILLITLSSRRMMNAPAG